VNKLRIVVIGLGKQMTKDHIPAVLRRDDVEIVAVVDKNEAMAALIGQNLNLPYFTETADAISKTHPDLALVCVPHNAYFEILEILAKNRIATLKEKPLAMSNEEAQRITDLYQSNETYLQICVQRRFSKLYETTKRLIQDVGTIYSVYVEYALNLNAEDMKSGWRADKSISGGGAVIDMGYHIVDLLTYIFGAPDKLYAQLNYNSVGEGYTIEDSMNTLMTFNEQINANIVVTKVANHKTEKIRILGDKGSIYIDNRTVTLFDENREDVEMYTYDSKDDEMDQQLDFFIDSYKSKPTITTKNNKLLADQILNMEIIDAIYESAKDQKVIRFNEESQ